MMWTPDLSKIITAEQKNADAREAVERLVDAERDRRVAGGFSFGDHRFQTRPEDRENLAGASTAALAAIVHGAQPGDYRWHGGESDFAWISEDNTLVPMDAQTMFAFGQAAMAHKQSMIFAARALKDIAEIPVDFADDANWPENKKPIARRTTQTGKPTVANVAPTTDSSLIEKARRARRSSHS